MTLDEFLVELEKTPRNWELSYGLIRQQSGKGDRDCPISAVIKMHESKSCFGSPSHSANIFLGMSPSLSFRIVRAADCVADNQQEIASLRALLLKACGITES